ncbi:MAG: flavin reductase family protein [Phycisphaeraceae bacterium]|nr:flavin reductase family protein [Phycisphaeraceae bacterium]
MSGTGTEKKQIFSLLKRLPGAVYLLTARHEDRRSGMLVRWVQVCSERPPMISVAVPKGRPIMLLISDSAMFGLCLLAEKDRIIPRRFQDEFNLPEDPFLGTTLAPASRSMIPLIAQCAATMECSVVCHMDVDGDHDLFIAEVVHAQAYPEHPPALSIPLPW